MKYTVHEPGSRLKVAEYKLQFQAFRHAYNYLPLESPGSYSPQGRYVTVQEWGDHSEPLRQWLISGRHQ